ncbi:MAG TPA: class I SAM-dependent methyltransferase [Anaerolineae bacterium]|nr:class I SAM-dependent methyltransferase [Anaerolineae bacterium]
MMVERSGEYLERGDYHLELDPNWVYLPVYLEKMVRVRKYLDAYDKETRILDIGCGEGALVKEYRDRGFDIVGLDINYESEYVIRGSVLNLEFSDKSFDLILLLDVIEHLVFTDQEIALQEIARVLRPGGELLISLPNLAHLASRFFFIFTGKLIRTSTPERHIGDRPIAEHMQLLKKHFEISKRIGIFPTFPLASLFTYWIPSKVILWHKLNNKLFAYPNWCFLNLVLAKKIRD